MLDGGAEVYTANLFGTAPSAALTQINGSRFPPLRSRVPRIQVGADEAPKSLNGAASEGNSVITRPRDGVRSHRLQEWSFNV